MTSRFTAASPGTARKAALAAVGVACAFLVFAGSASADTFRPANDAEFVAAFSSANANGVGHDTIILADTFYQPPGNPIVITSDLTVTGDHARQTDGAGPAIDLTAINPTPTNGFSITVAPGVTVRFTGHKAQSGGPDGTYRIRGTAIFDHMYVAGNPFTQIVVDSGGTARLNNTAVDQGQTTGIRTQGTLVLNNSNVTANVQGGIDNVAGSNVTLNNSIVANLGATDCAFPVQSTTSSLDLTGPTSQCGVALHGDPVLNFYDYNGGPTDTAMPLAGSPLINAGSNATCPTTDARFFVRPVGQCDIGSYEVGAAQDTTAPSCPDLGASARTETGGIRRMTVPVRDSGSGIGHDAVRMDEQITIVNGTVSFVPFASPFRNPGGTPPSTAEGLVVTATKTDQTQSTQWSFVARDWAGNRTNCGSSAPLPVGP